MSDPAAIEASIHLLFDAESNAFLAEHDLVTDYDEEEDEGTRVLSDKAISLLAAWLAGGGVGAPVNYLSNEHIGTDLTPQLVEDSLQVIADALGEHLYWELDSDEETINLLERIITAARAS